jgi:putative addiction module antidote
MIGDDVITYVILQSLRRLDMPTTTKVIAIGNSAGIILPKETLARLKVKKGDTVCLSETPLGAHLTPYDEQFMRKMEATERVMRKYRDALRKLAE